MTIQEIRHQEIATELREIRHYYTEDELAAHREQFTENEFMLADEELALAEVARGYKERIKEFKLTSKAMREAIRAKYIDSKKTVSVVPNFLTGQMEYYEGTELVDSRKLRPTENQMNILQSKAI